MKVVLKLKSFCIYGLGVTGMSVVNFFNKNIINIEKLLWKLKKIEIYTDNLKNEKLLNFEKMMIKFFQLLKIMNYIKY